LWVEEARRREGIAAALIEAARREAAKLSHETCYLCATPENSVYYLKRGFTQIEADITGLNVFRIPSAAENPSKPLK
jgi:N-acetylglutamate synthase-like GNAT family acetyltransferase